MLTYSRLQIWQLLMLLHILSSIHHDKHETSLLGTTLRSRFRSTGPPVYHNPWISDNRWVGSMTVLLSAVVVLDILPLSRNVGKTEAS